jgi:transcriptional regulator with XRE-family HTH domain
MNIGSAIRTIRIKMHLSQVELAKRCQLSQTSLSQIENNNKKPSARTLKRICEELQVPESIIYILAMENIDVPESRKKIYDVLFPAITAMAMQIIGTDGGEDDLKD